MGNWAEAGRPVEGRLDSDERWQLAQRIVASPPFQRAGRLRALLLYLVEESILGRASQLSEQRIGHFLFGKPTDYSPAEDSSVRANARLLRLRLHEYYDSYGRTDSVIIELPKGNYAPVFRPSGPAQEPIFPKALEPAALTRSGQPARVALLAALCALCAIAGYLVARPQTATPPPSWPLSEVFDPHTRTQVVVSDINYGLLCLLSGRIIGLEEYLSPQYPASAIPADSSTREAHLASYLSRTQFVSYADSVFVSHLLPAFGGGDRLWLRSARDLKTHDLEEGNFIFVGSPASNPWVSLFEDQLNFVEVKLAGAPGSIVNRHPGPGELQRYSGIGSTGSSGEDYAALALLSSASRRGNVLILQGLQQEGTEAASLLVSTEEGRAALRAALHISSGTPARGVFFEALIRAKVVGGSAAGTEIVATRLLH
jgi:hypothetical protein